MNKHYGVFGICVRGYHASNFRNQILSCICHLYFFETPHGSLNADRVFTDKDEAAQWARSSREHYAWSSKYSRSKEWSTRFFVHECREDGQWLPTKKDISDAVAYAKTHIDLKRVTAQDAEGPLKPEYAAEFAAELA